MNARPINKTQPHIDSTALEQGIKDIRDVIALVTDAKEEAEAMLTNCRAALKSKPLDIELQSQVLRLNDYIIKQTQNICTLEGQITEIERSLKMCDCSDNTIN